MSVDFNPSNLKRKSVLKDMNGNIINLLDEADGGWIIRGRQIVNQDKWNQILQKEEDKRLAAQASAEQVLAPKHIEAQRAGNKESTVNPPDKVDLLEKKVDNMESKLDAILKALNK